MLNRVRKRASILIVDDDKQVTDLFCMMLRRDGYTVDTVHNGGSDAPAKAHEKMPDLILLSFDLSGITGYEVAERLSKDEKTRNIPIIMISEEKDTVDRVRALKAGAKDFLTKPVFEIELKARISTLLKMKYYNDSILGDRIGRPNHEALKSYARFVPRDLLRLLLRSGTDHVKLGAQVLENLAILTSRIRSFATLSKKMTSGQLFSFLNSYIKRIDTFIWDNGGFIDKYSGDSIRAFFPEGDDSALTAAIDMIRHIPVYNEHRRHFDYDPVHIGIGLHSGPVMIGAFGTERYIQVAAISSSVNLTARLESLTKLYGNSIIASDSIISGLRNSTANYRFLDKIRVEGLGETTSVYEVFDGDPPELIEQKLKTQSVFEKGVYEYHTDSIRSAHQQFSEIKGSEKTDQAVRVYRERCEYFLKHGIKKPIEYIE